MTGEEENQFIEELNHLCLLFYDKVYFSKALQNLPNPNNVRECFDFVRIGIKYLLFDIEASRREGKK